MVGVFLGRPKTCQTGIVIMRDARDTLLALGSLTNIVVTKDDASCIRMKATWQDSRFTLTLTGNTGYVFLQGPSASLLAFGSHVASAIGGALHVAKDVGADPHNPDAGEGGAPEMTEPVAAEPSAEATPRQQSEQQQQQQQQYAVCCSICGAAWGDMPYAKCNICGLVNANHHGLCCRRQREQQQQQPTGARPPVVTSASEGASSSVASASEGASSGVVSGEGNVMVNVTFNNSTDAPAELEGLANMLLNLLRIGGGQRGA